MPGYWISRNKIERCPGFFPPFSIPFFPLYLGDLFGFPEYFSQHSFICRPSDSSVSEDAGIEPRTVVTLTLANQTL
jgi:hypothetical protein